MSKIWTNISTTPLTTHRLEALADGVFAIVMTLLVLELSIPAMTGSSVNLDLTGKLIELWPKILIYMLSFVVLGIMWVNHHIMFHFITRSDGRLAWINIILLMFAALIPFSASLIGEYSQAQVAVIVYGVNVLLIIAMNLVIWIYITGNNKLADKAISGEIAVRRKIMYLVGCFFIIVAIGISFISPIASLYIYGLSALLSIIISWQDSHGFLSIALARIWRKSV